MSSTVAHLPPRPTPAAGVPTTHGALALDTRERLAPPAPRPGTGARGCDLVEVQEELRSALEQWVGRHVQAALEIIAGDRPPGQLARWNRHDVHQDLVRRAVLVARAGGHEVGRGRRRGLSRPSVHRVRLSFLTDEVVEAAVHVRHGGRARAVAGRFEVHRGRWVCSALEFC